MRWWSLLYLLLAVSVRRCSQLPSVFVGEHEVHFVHPKPDNATVYSNGTLESEQFLIQIVSTNRSTVESKNVTDVEDYEDYEDYEYDDEWVTEDARRKFNVTLPDGQLVNVFAGPRSVTLYFPKSPNAGESKGKPAPPSSHIEYDDEFLEDVEDEELEEISGRNFGVDNCLIIVGNDPLFGTLSRSYKPVENDAKSDRDHWDNFGDVLAEIISKLRKMEEDVKQRPPYPRPVYERPAARERPVFRPKPDPDIPILDTNYDYNVDDHDSSPQPSGYGAPKYRYGPEPYVTTGYSVPSTTETSLQTTTGVPGNATSVTTPQEPGNGTYTTSAGTTAEPGNYTFDTTSEKPGNSTGEPGNLITSLGTSTGEPGNLTSLGTSTGEPGNLMTSLGTSTGEPGNLMTSLGTSTGGPGNLITSLGTSTGEPGNLMTSLGTSTGEPGNLMTSLGTSTGEPGIVSTMGTSTVEPGNLTSQMISTGEPGSVTSVGSSTGTTGVPGTATALGTLSGELKNVTSVGTSTEIAEEPGNVISVSTSTGEPGILTSQMTSTVEPGIVTTVDSSTGTTGEPGIVTTVDSSTGTTGEPGIVTTVGTSPEEPGIVTSQMSSPEEPGILTSQMTSTGEPGIVTTVGTSPEEPGIVTTVGTSPEEPGIVTTVGTSPEEPGFVTTVGTSPEEPGILTMQMTSTGEPGILTSQMTSTGEPGIVTSQMISPEEPGNVTTVGTSTEEPGVLTSQMTSTEEPGVLTSQMTSTEEPVILTPQMTSTEEPVILTSQMTSPEEPGVVTSQMTSPEEPGVVTSQMTSPEEPRIVTTVGTSTEEPGILTSQMTSTGEPGIVITVDSSTGSTGEPGIVTTVGALTGEPGNVTSVGTSTGTAGESGDVTSLGNSTGTIRKPCYITSLGTSTGTTAEPDHSTMATTSQELGNATSVTPVFGSSVTSASPTGEPLDVATYGTAGELHHFTATASQTSEDGTSMGTTGEPEKITLLTAHQQLDYRTSATYDRTTVVYGNGETGEPRNATSVGVPAEPGDVATLSGAEYVNASSANATVILVTSSETTLQLPTKTTSSFAYATSESGVSSPESTPAEPGNEFLLDVRQKEPVTEPSVTSTSPTRAVKSLGRAADDHTSDSRSVGPSVTSTSMVTEDYTVVQGLESTNVTRYFHSESSFAHNETFSNATLAQNEYDPTVSDYREWISARAANETEHDPISEMTNKTIQSSNITGTENVTESSSGYRLNATEGYFTDGLSWNESSQDTPVPFNLSHLNVQGNLTTLETLSEDIMEYILFVDPNVDNNLNGTLNQTSDVHHNISLYEQLTDNSTLLGRTADIAETPWNVSLHSDVNDTYEDPGKNDTIYERAFRVPETLVSLNATLHDQTMSTVSTDFHVTHGANWSLAYNATLAWNGSLHHGVNDTYEGPEQRSAEETLVPLNQTLASFNSTLPDETMSTISTDFKVAQETNLSLPYNTTVTDAHLVHVASTVSDVPYNAMSLQEHSSERDTTPTVSNYNSTTSPDDHITKIARFGVHHPTVEQTTVSVANYTSDEPSLNVTTGDYRLVVEPWKRSRKMTLYLLEKLVESKVIFTEEAIDLFTTVDLESLLPLIPLNGDYGMTLTPKVLNTTMNSMLPDVEIEFSLHGVQGNGSTPGYVPGQPDGRRFVSTNGTTPALIQSTPITMPDTTSKSSSRSPRYYGPFLNRLNETTSTPDHQVPLLSVENTSGQPLNTTILLEQSTLQPEHLDNQTSVGPHILEHELRFQGALLINSSVELYVPKRHAEQFPVLDEVDHPIVECNSTEDCHANGNERCINGECSCGKGFSRKSSFGICVPNSRSMDIVRVASVIGDVRNLKGLEVSGDPCAAHEMNHCSHNAFCYPDDQNPIVPYICVCREGFKDESPNAQYPGEVCNGICHYEMCNGRGTCSTNPDGSILCNCETWFMGQHCEMDGLAIMFGVIGGFGIVVTICLGSFCIYYRLVNARRWASLV